jgi:DNA-binding MarR family transcriptional regulator
MKRNQSYEKIYEAYTHFRRCANAVILARDRELREVGTTTAKSAIMDAINHYKGNASLGEIANFLVLTPHTVVGAINRMEKEGLVRRKKGGPGAGRTTYVSLTQKGRYIWQDVKKSRELIMNLFSGLSNEDLEQLDMHLNHMREVALEKSLELSTRKKSNLSKSVI